MKALLRKIGEQAVLIDKFLEVLDQEAQALSDGSFAALTELTRRKGELADQLAAADCGREGELVALGYPGNRRGADAAAADGGERLGQAWGRLMELAAEARDSNHRNGVMIHAHLDYTRQSISFLQAGNRPLYGPDGNHRAPAASGTHRAAG
jgi:flagella synthesis protein FlgN